MPELNGSQQFNCHGFSTGVWTAWMLWTSRLDRAAALSCSKPRLVAVPADVGGYLSPRILMLASHY